MIAVLTGDGGLVRVLPAATRRFGLHSRFGWIAEDELASRAHRKARYLDGKRDSARDAWAFLLERSGETFATVAGACALRGGPASGWDLESPVGTFRMQPHALASALPLPAGYESEAVDARRDRRLQLATLLALLLCVSLGVVDYLLPKSIVEPEVLPPPVTVKVELQRPVKIQLSQELQQVQQKVVEQRQTKRAIQQNLGFLGLLGRKDLTKALGGIPTKAKDVSPGAGKGGTEGSGGEYLVGLGQGVHRATVGNSGVAGLGGVGTKGAGGGAGGYGNTSVGSGEGRGLSQLARANEIVLDGGLDRNVIQATIAKYLHEVRACYEDGLRAKPGIAGQVAMSWVIGADGGVNAPRVQRSSLGHPGVESCISTRMTQWKFPKPVGGVTVPVTYPFVLRPAGA